MDRKLRYGLSREDKKALRRLGVRRPRVVEVFYDPDGYPNRVVRGYAIDGITPIEGVAHDGESWADVKWRFI